jgi:hypothetical protein
VRECCAFGVARCGSFPCAKNRKLELCLWFFLSCLLTSLAVAQTTKISGTAKCGKNQHRAMVPVGDRPNHSFGVTQGSCTWSKAWMITGVASKEGVGTDTLEADGEGEDLWYVCGHHGVHQFAIKVRRPLWKWRLRSGSQKTSWHNGRQKCLRGASI